MTFAESQAQYPFYYYYYFFARSFSYFRSKNDLEDSDTYLCCSFTSLAQAGALDILAFGGER
jgi:hypothetical protein